MTGPNFDAYLRSSAEHPKGYKLAEYAKVKLKQQTIRKYFMLLP